MSKKELSRKKPNYLLPIIVMFFLFAMISFVTGFQNPFGTILKEQLALSNWQSQLGNAANFIAYAFMGLPAGMILQRKGYKFTAMTAVLVGLAGVGLMLLSSTLTGTGAIFAVYLTGAFVAGFSMCMLNTVVNPMLFTLGGGGNRSNQLLQYGGSCNSLAATICPVLVGYLIGDNLSGASLQSAQPALYIAAGIFAFALLVLAISKLPEPDLERARQLKAEGKEETKQPSIAGALRYRHYVLGVIAIFIYVGVEVGIPTYANYFMLNDLNIAPAVAGSLVGAYWFLMLVGRFIGGMLGEKVSARQMLTTATGVALCFLICAIVFNPETKMQIVGVTSTLEFDVVDVPVNILFMVLCGLCTSVMWGGIFNLAVQGLNKFTTVASGFFMVMVCGGGILPLIQGAVSDVGGYLISFVVPLLGVLYMLFFALIGSKPHYPLPADDSEQL